MLKGIVIGFLLFLSGAQYVPSGPVFPSASGASCTAPLLGSGALDAWPMCEGSGTTLFDKVSSNPINVPVNSLINAIWGAVGGFPGVPLTFNSSASRSTGAFVVGASSPNWAIASWSTAFSTCAWLNATTFNTPSEESALISTIDPANNFQGWELEVDNAIGSGGDGNVVFQILNNVSTTDWLNVTQTSTISHNALHQVCATYDGSRTAAGALIYVDGAAVATTAVHNTLSASNAPVNNIGLGNRISSASVFTNPLAGTLGWESIWACALSPTVIANNFAAGPSFTGLHC